MFERLAKLDSVTWNLPLEAILGMSVRSETRFSRRDGQQLGSHMLQQPYTGSSRSVYHSLQAESQRTKAETLLYSPGRSHELSQVNRPNRPPA